MYERMFGGHLGCADDELQAKNNPKIMSQYQNVIQICTSNLYSLIMIIEYPNTQGKIFFGMDPSSTNYTLVANQFGMCPT